MSKLSNARAQLDAWEAKKPESYTSQYKDKIDGVMGQLDGMKDFSYDPTRDAAYEQYKNSYTRQAKLANENAQANASAISGGYGSSYGTQAGQSAYQNAMAGLSNATNSLYSPGAEPVHPEKERPAEPAERIPAGRGAGLREVPDQLPELGEPAQLLSERVQSGGQRKPGEEEPGDGPLWDDPERCRKSAAVSAVKIKRPARKRLSAWGFMQDGAFPSRHPEGRRRS